MAILQPTFYLVFAIIVFSSVFLIRYMDQNHGLGKEPETIDEIISAKFTNEEIMNAKVGCERK